jgi:tetratricopeptide (TPR) repeat protein
LQRAEKSYERILKKWPSSLGAAIGKANIAYSKKAYSEAVQYLQQATKFHPDSAIAWHNLTLAYGESQAQKKARASAQEALRLANSEERVQFMQSLKDWL